MQVLEHTRQQDWYLVVAQISARGERRVRRVTWRRSCQKYKSINHQWHSCVVFKVGPNYKGLDVKDDDKNWKKLLQFKSQPKGPTSYTFPSWSNLWTSQEPVYSSMVRAGSGGVSWRHCIRRLLPLQKRWWSPWVCRSTSDLRNFYVDCFFHNLKVKVPVNFESSLKYHRLQRGRLTEPTNRFSAQP